VTGALQAWGNVRGARPIDLGATLTVLVKRLVICVSRPDCDVAARSCNDQRMVGTRESL
jgi:hypothetical protein